MKALSIRQPFAWLISNGFKDIENRTWPTRRTGTILIHAGKQESDNYCLKDIRAKMDDDDAFNDLINAMDKPESYGGIVGIVDIIECVDYHNSKWFGGPWGFVLGNSYTVPYYPYKGKLSFFEVDYPHNLGDYENK